MVLLRGAHIKLIPRRHPVVGRGYGRRVPDSRFYSYELAKHPCHLLYTE